MARLTPELLPQLNEVRQPLYDRLFVRPGIVHLGIGAFHRAHQAFYTEEVMNLQGGDWGIIGCSLRSGTVRDQLAPQQGLYTLVVRSEVSQAQIIGAVQKVLVGPANPAEVIRAIGSEHTHIVSLTITEKGYCHHPASGELNFEHPDIRHDLSNLAAPRSAVGYLVAGLMRRRSASLSGLTIMSCDNLPHNGAVTRKVVLDFAYRVDAALAQWIESEVAFPSTMIDRIVPATTPEDVATLRRQHGYTDEGMVVAEPFSQWVIEDHFCGKRPAWELAGALIVNDVAPFEILKLRLLNGTHSLLAYTGCLAGYGTVYEVMQDADFVRLSWKFMDAAATTFEAPDDFDVQAYKSTLIERFANPGLQHRTWQIAMDGSQKIPQRWLNSLRVLLREGGDVEPLCFALAAWMRYVSCRDEEGAYIRISDPCAPIFQRIHAEHGDNWAGYVAAFFHLTSIFGDDLQSNTAVVEKTTAYLSGICKRGIKPVLRDLVARDGSFASA